MGAAPFVFKGADFSLCNGQLSGRFFAFLRVSRMLTWLEQERICGNLASKIGRMQYL